MVDLAALTAATGDEFAMFTRGPTRLVIRGDSTHVNITKAAAAELNAQGYRWSGHTHPGLYGGMELIASDEENGHLRFEQTEHTYRLRELRTAAEPAMA